MRIPEHIGVIPDGNRRWAQENGLSKEKGYKWGLEPGIKLLRLCKEQGIKEITYYGFTMDNTKRPKIQTNAFTSACIEAVKMIEEEDASLFVVGNTDSKKFPQELISYTHREKIKNGGIKVNFLVNYGWKWDLDNFPKIHSEDISRIDLIIRWGGRRRLSGFLPTQSVYSDFYVVDDYWPDFKRQHFHDALQWYAKQDVTLGG